MEYTDDFSANPFTALFHDVETARTFAEGTKLVLSSLPSSLEETIENETVAEDASKSGSNLNEDVIFSDFLEHIFLFTIDFDGESKSGIQLRSLPPCCVKLVELQKEYEDNSSPFLLSLKNLNQALYERLQMSEPSSYAIIRSHGKNLSRVSMDCCEKCLIKYLSECYCRLNREEALLKYQLSTHTNISSGKGEGYEKELSDIANECRKLVMSYTGSILLQPEIFPVEKPYSQLLLVLQSAYSEPHLNDFVEELIKLHNIQDDLEIMFSPVLDEMWKSLDVSLLDPSLFPILHALSIYSKHLSLASCLLKSKYWLPPRDQLNGSSFEHQTILGKILRVSYLPHPGKQVEYFLSPSVQSDSEVRAITGNIRQYINNLVTQLHKFLHNLCQLPGFKHEVLVWIGLCLNANAKHFQMFADKTLAGPGFFLNLTHVLLKFCEPFSSPTSDLLLKVDCRYGAVSCTPESIIKSDTPLHAIALDKYTTMVPKPEEATAVDFGSLKFNFISEMFFLTHICYKLGFIKVYERYEDLMKRLRKLHDVYQDALSQGGVPSAIEGLKNDFEHGMRLLLAVQAHLLNPSIAELSLKFSVSSGYWLVQQTFAGDDYMINQFRELQADQLNSEISTAFTVIPELIPENVGDTLRHMGHFDGESLEQYEHLAYVMNFFAVFLGDKSRIKNPHLRAKLAECLAVFLPKEKLGLSRTNNFSLNHRKDALEQPVVVEVLPQSLLQLFVDIEFTGHTMEFDQKFMYRRHMYVILEYIWQIPSYLSSFKNLHKKGKQMYDREKQLGTFPRFINLLINDSTFLLDEALQNLVTIKELEKEKANGEWENLNPQEKQEKEKHLTQSGHLAEGYNTMAKETVKVICYITKDIDRPFVSHIMADSMASFLNYFFVHLVGPKRKQLKVSDFKKYNFEPDQLVKNITKIYLQLGKYDDFCQSIAKDTRSYSHALFESAFNVLLRLEGAYEMAHELQVLSVKLETLSLKLAKAEKEMPEPPEEFIDPISCELMQQPVKLPSSGKIICRSTIAKHLLSDEKDPFNRSPLRLDQVIPCDELEQRIKDWMKENLIERPGSMSD